jgi:hypothetical protein
MPINPGDYVAYRVPPPHGRGIKVYVRVLKRLPAGQFEVTVPPDPQRPGAPNGNLLVNGNLLDENDKLLIRPVANKAKLQRALTERYALIELPADQIVPHGAAFFRGDDRDPLIVFEMGFRTRQLHSRPIFRARIPQGLAQVNQFDIDPESGICLTERPAAAVIFPLKKAGVSADHTFLYVAYAPQFVRTYKVQKLARDAYTTSDVRDHIDRLAFAREVVVPSGCLPGNQIAGCFRVGRLWTGTEWTDGLTVTLGHFKPNTHFVHQNHSQYANFLNLITVRVQQIPRQLGPF